MLTASPREHGGVTSPPERLQRTIRFESEDARDRAFVSWAQPDGPVEILAEPTADGIVLWAESSGDPVAAVAAIDAVGGRLADVERFDARSTLLPDDPDVEGRAAEMFAARALGSDRIADLRLAVRAIDLTTLEGDDTAGRVRWLCSRAIRPDPLDPETEPTAAVCVHPAFVGLARHLTAETPVKVASVAGAFPSGHSRLDVRLADIAAAREAGAHEIDIVLNRAAFLIGNHQLAADEIRASAEAAGDCHLKVILEVGDLGSDAAIRSATRLAIEAGADFVKTSTGKTPRNATPAAVLAMAEVIAGHADRTGHMVGLKVAGGVRTPDEALGYLALVRATLGDEWLQPERFRFGASGLLGNLVVALRD